MPLLATIATILVVLLAPLGSARAKVIDSVFVAGDSLSDPGNVFRITSTVAQALPWLVRPIPASPPYDAGRFSDGPVWVEYLAASLGVEGEAVTNLALGGANTDTHTLVGDAPRFLRPFLEASGLGGIQQQVDVHLAAGGRISPDGLHVLWGGANDWLFGTVTITDEGLPSTVANLRSTILDLAAAGARHFLVPNLPDLGQIPATVGDPLRSSALSQATFWHNGHLQAMASTLASTLGLQVDVLDVAGYFALAQAGAFGFANVSTPCIDVPETCATSLFFDGLHPTTAAHAQLAWLAGAVVAPVPDVAAAQLRVVTPIPAPALLLGGGLLALVGLRRAARRRGAPVGG